MNLKKIMEVIEAVILSSSTDPDHQIEWACATDLMSEVLFYSKEKSILLTGLSNSQVVRTAEIADIDVVVFTRGKEPAKETVDLAKKKGITLLVTPLSLFSAAGKLYAEGLRCCPDGK